MDGLERVAVQPVQPLASVFAHVDRPHLSEHPQVLGHLRLGQPERPHEVVHGPLAAREGVQDLPPPGLGHRVERIRRRRCSCHASNIYPYRNMSRKPRTRFAVSLGAMDALSVAIWSDYT